MFAASKLGDNLEVKNILKKEKFSIDATDYEGKTYKSKNIAVQNLKFLVHWQTF